MKYSDILDKNRKEDTKAKLINLIFGVLNEKSLNNNIKLINIGQSKSTESIYPLFFDLKSSKAILIRMSGHKRKRIIDEQEQLLFEDYNSFAEIEKALISILIDKTKFIEIDESSISEIELYSSEEQCKELFINEKVDSDFAFYYQAEDKKLKQINDEKQNELLWKMKQLNILRIGYIKRGFVQIALNNEYKQIIKNLHSLVKQNLIEQKVIQEKLDRNSKVLENMLLLVKTSENTILVKSNRRTRKSIKKGNKILILDKISEKYFTGICMDIFASSRKSSHEVSSEKIALKILK